MFPAYNNLSKETNKNPLFPIVSDDKSQLQKQNESKNLSITKSYSSFKPSISDTSSSLIDQTKLVQLDDEVYKKKSKKREKDSKKHKKHKKKKKRSIDSEGSSCSESESNSSEYETKKRKMKLKKEVNTDFQYMSQSYKNAYLEKLLFDEKYNSYYSKFTHEKLKSFKFYEDLPLLEPRNAFKIDKKGDKNNICFDQVNNKYLCKYFVPYLRGETSEKLKSKKNFTKLSKKQLRKKILNEAREKRYYSQVKKLSQVEVEDECKKKQSIDVADLSRSTMSNKMWLYLEMKSELEREYETNASNKVDKTSDYMKYLDEHKDNIEKWLEFIDYQTNETDQEEKNINQNSFVLYEKKMAIFDKAIQQNPNNFRLKLERLKFKSNSFEILNSYNALEIIENDYLNMLINESSNITLKSFNQSMQNELLSNLFEIWFEYLKFLTNTNSSSIMFNKIKRTYQNCFEYFLSSDSNEFIRKNSNSVVFFNFMLQLLDNYCNFLCKNGYIEKVIGIYQAMIDFNFNSSSLNPKSPYNNMDFKFKKTLFELFWDTGLPKFGEKHSIGWLNCLENRDKIFKSLENDDELTKIRYEDQLDLIESKILTWQNIRVEYRWYEIERLRSLLNWYPFYPQIVLGESSDDCADQDRLIAYEDDLSFLLFDLNNLTVNCQNREEKVEYLKFKLFCKLLKTLNLISWDEECLNLNVDKNNFSHVINSSKIFDDEDTEYMRYLNGQIDYLNDEKSIDRHDIQFCGNFNFLHNLVFNLNDPYKSNNFRSYDQSEIDNLRNIIKKVLLNTIEFIRNCFTQIKDLFQITKFKTNSLILKWKFELTLINLFKNVSQDLNDDRLNYKKLKQNLLDETKQTLSLTQNRTNFDLWKHYGILKWLLNHIETQPETVSLKETRKVFDNLLNTIDNSIDVYSFCLDYVQLELGIYYNQYDVNTSSLDEDIATLPNLTSISTLSTQNGFFNLKQIIPKTKNINMAGLVEILASNCLKRSIKQDNQTKLKEKLTFKIGMSSMTKLLLAKRDFQTEYDLILNECRAKKCDLIKLFYYHKVYSLFLLCTNDFEKLIEINDNMVIKETVLSLYQSMIIEFYINILNYLYFQERKLTKFMFKTKLFTIVRATLSTKNNYNSYLRLLQLTLLRLKIQNSSLFCSEVLENNDIDLMFNKIALKLSMSKIFGQQICSSSFSLTLIFSHLRKLNEIIEKAESNEKDDKMSLFSLDIQQHGHQNKIRRLFEQALKLNPKSIQLWLYYFKFELIFIEENKFYMNKQQLSSFQNRILYIYYQSIRNLPHCKLFYVNSIKCIPEKYIEIMNLMSNRELRLYFPIQELNMLLEPIKRPGELENENENDEIKDGEEIESLNSSFQSLSSLNKTNDDESDELIDSNDEKKTNDSSSQHSSNSNISNFDLKDL